MMALAEAPQMAGIRSRIEASLRLQDILAFERLLRSEPNAARIRYNYGFSEAPLLNHILRQPLPRDKMLAAVEIAIRHGASAGESDCEGLKPSEIIDRKLAYYAAAFRRYAQNAIPPSMLESCALFQDLKEMLGARRSEGASIKPKPAVTVKEARATAPAPVLHYAPTIPARQASSELTIAQLSEILSNAGSSPIAALRPPHSKPLVNLSIELVRMVATATIGNSPSRDSLLGLRLADFSKRNLDAVIPVFFNNSLYEAVNAAYPKYSIMPWEMHFRPANLFESPQARIAAVRWLVQDRLKIASDDRWAILAISMADIKPYRAVKAMLATYHNSIIYNMLNEAYPEHLLKPWEVVHRPPGIFEDPTVRIAATKWLVESVLRIRPEWIGPAAIATRGDFERAGLGSLVARFPAPELLKEAYPNPKRDLRGIRRKP